jgi:hypothetical protein
MQQLPSLLSIQEILGFIIDPNTIYPELFMAFLSLLAKQG